jgi:hypothetical protein
MRLFSYFSFALGLLLAACPATFTTKHPPCDENADCSIEKLGSDFADYICADQKCYPKDSAPQLDSGSGIGGVYDAGTAIDSGQSWDCQRDSDCQDGQICGDGVCVDVEAGCSNDEQCPNGQVCRESACLTSCTGHAGCEPSLVCLETVCVERPTCSQSSRVPLPPSADVGLPVGDSGATPFADTGPAPAADSGPAPVADSGPAPGVDAGASSSCPADLLCDAERCIRPECYDGHPCPNTQTCQQGRCVAN